MPLTRRFSPFGMLLLSLNGMIGSAWLFAPLYAAKIAGSTALIAWILGGFATILVALTFAELSTFLPIAGGTSRFSQLSHGTFTGFMISWVSWLSCVTMPPIEVQAVLQYSANYFPSLTHVVGGSHELTYYGMIWAILIMLGLSIINIASFKGLVRFNYVIFAFKILVIILAILLLIHARFFVQNFAGLSHVSSINDWHAILAAVATGGVIFAFTGFKHGVEMAGETKNSQIAIPLAIVGSVIICLILYLGLQIAFIGAVDPKNLLNGWKNLSFAGDAGPFAGLALLVGLVFLAKLLYIDAAVSPLGTGLVYVTSTARLVYAMSKNNYLPEFLSRLSQRNNFPVYAIIFNFLVGMLLFLPFPGWQSMVSFLVSAVIISYAMGPISLICLRRQLPQEQRPFRLPIAEFLCLLAFYFCNLMSYWIGWDTMWKLAIALVVGLSLYGFNYVRSKQWQQNNGVKSIFWLLPYLSGLILISYFGTYGGKNIIPFGWDFLIIGIFTVAIFYLAIWVRAGSVLQQFRQYQSTELNQNLEENLK